MFVLVAFTSFANFAVILVQKIRTSQAISHQPDKQDVLSDPVNHLPDKKELKVTPKIVVSNLGTNTGWSAGTIALSRKKARDGCLNKGMVKEITDKKEERFESLEDKGSFLSIRKSTFSDLKRRVGEDGAEEVKIS